MYVLCDMLISVFVCGGVPDESMQKCFGEGSGVVYQDILAWLQSSNTQLQLSGALAIANFARNGKFLMWVNASQSFPNNPTAFTLFYSHKLVGMLQLFTQNISQML